MSTLVGVGPACAERAYKDIGRPDVASRIHESFHLPANHDAIVTMAATRTWSPELMALLLGQSAPVDKLRTADEAAFDDQFESERVYLIETFVFNGEPVTELRLNISMHFVDRAYIVESWEV